MSLGCARCGSCCDPVYLQPDIRDRIDVWREIAEDVWSGAAPDGDIAFVLTHWHQLDRERGAHYRCDRYDPEHRTCTAHDDRPEVCSGFPFYGHPPAVSGGAFPAGSTCSYLLDVPPLLRPADTRPLIPIEVL